MPETHAMLFEDGLTDSRRRRSRQCTTVGWTQVRFRRCRAEYGDWLIDGLAVAASALLALCLTVMGRRAPFVHDHSRSFNLPQPILHALADVEMLIAREMELGPALCGVPAPGSQVGSLHPRRTL